MPTYFQKPENALKRANEFIDVGKSSRALDVLYDVIKSKKHRTWQKGIHEGIMEEYLRLCVELKKSHIAKEGLYQYKNICQQVNIKSLEDVVRKYLALAEKKTEEAKAESHQAVVDIDDLDNALQSPESLLLSAVSGEDTQDRTDRAILTPWVKFLWESYRQCLDLLRNNSSVEKLYQDIAQQAFKFCLNYSRKTEFRKLCDNLRTHLGHIHKHQHQQRAINLNNPESQAMHLETRLVQLESAIQMELWQEAYKAIEDVNGFILLSKKPPKPSLMANYYQKLALVFKKAGNHLFHACALARLLQLSKEQKKNLSSEEAQKLASRVLCATLSIPIPPSRNQMANLLDFDETALEKERRLASLLNLQNPPTRQSLVNDLVKTGIVQSVNPQLSNLYRWLEVEFHPLKLSSRVANSLEFIEKNPDLSQYTTAIQEITITRLLKQVSQVYQTIEFSRLAALAPFVSEFQLEKVIVHEIKNLELQVRIDHQSRSLSFGTDLAVSQKEDAPEGPSIQAMPSEQIRSQLTNMASALQKAINVIKPTDGDQETEDLRAHIVKNYRSSAKTDHTRILQRRHIIEERKEELENINTERERLEYEKIREAQQEQIAAEEARLLKEADMRAAMKKQEEHDEIKRKHAKERLEQLKKSDVGASAFKDLSEQELAELDADEIMAKQVEQLEKEKKELQERLKAQERKVDHFARAKRVEEIPLLLKKFDEDREEMKNFWYREEEERITQAKSEREYAIANRERLKRMETDKNAFMNKLKEARQSVYKENVKAFNKRLAEERKRRLEERKQTRKDERRQRYIQEKEEEAQRIRDEKLKREREEKERLEQEQRELEEAAYRDKLAKLEEQAEKQRKREQEIEERNRAREEAQKSRPRQGEDRWGRDGDRDRDRDRDDRGRDEEDGSPRRGAWKPPAKEGGGWRERQKQKEDSWKSPREKEVPEDRGESTWRSRMPARDIREEYRKQSPEPPRDQDEEPPRRRELSPPQRGGDRFRDDRGPSPRGRDNRDTWRRGGDDRRGGPAPRDDDRGSDRWRRGGDDEPRGGGGGWRDRRGGDDDRRDDRGGDDRGGWRGRGGDDRGMDRGGGGGGRWGRDDDRRDDRDSRPRGDDGGRWRAGGGGGGGGGWRDRERERDSRPPPRDDREDRWRRDDPPRDRDSRREPEGGWRRGGDDRPPPRTSERPPPRDGGGPEDDGWTTVKTK
ncbi:unnamed protein product [Owenia fusiformis]|uniref:Eukaryotic translation initiation factor 3 subunit A n=1 Tax=Owenia fusiformis TaxID=6347 RepID=A0A8S4NW28_OWEFU|nr:unnamed protein product [Owenia fusiformis]